MYSDTEIPDVNDDNDDNNDNNNNNNSISPIINESGRTAKEEVDYYEAIRIPTEDFDKLGIYEDKPYKWWKQYKNHKKMWYLEKYAKYQWVNPVSNNIAERGFKISRHWLNYKASQMGDDKLMKKHILMDWIKNKNKNKGIYIYFLQKIKIFYY